MWSGWGRWLVPAALAVAAVVVLAVGLPSVSPTVLLGDDGPSSAGTPAADDTSPGSPSAEAGDENAGAEDGEDVAAPTTVTIPAIDVREDLVELGLRDDGGMEVPDFGGAGWYEPGPRPGEAGGAVIAAHYDSVDGPDVFYDLAELDAGDEVRVTAADGRTGVWEVTGAERTPKDELPNDRIWPGTDEPQLALITCGGVFDDDTGHYTHNDIVYAAWRGWQGG